MRTPAKYISVLFFFMIAFNQCKRDTKLLGHVTVKGQVIHFFTKKPIANQDVQLYSEPFHSNQGDPTLIGQTTTDSEGNFSIKAHKSRKNSYYLYYGSECSNTGDTAFHSKKDIDLGAVFSGRRTLVYRIHLIPTSFNCIWVPDDSGNMQKIMSGTDTYLFYHKDFSYCQIKTGKFYSFVCRKDVCVNTKTVATSGTNIPFYNTDTLSLDVSY
jgi:hypothetical protein